jgi:hypothetical protein
MNLLSRYTNTDVNMIDCLRMPAIHCISKQTGGPVCNKACSRCRTLVLKGVSVVTSRKEGKSSVHFSTISCMVSFSVSKAAGAVSRFIAVIQLESTQFDKLNTLCNYHRDVQNFAKIFSKGVACITQQSPQQLRNSDWAIAHMSSSSKPWLSLKILLTRTKGDYHVILGTSPIVCLIQPEHYVPQRPIRLELPDLVTTSSGIQVIWTLWSRKELLRNERSKILKATLWNISRFSH